jgi:hypothetical protein
MNAEKRWMEADVAAEQADQENQRFAVRCREFVMLSYACS